MTGETKDGRRKQRKFTKTVREAFLDHLAATAHVEDAASTAGFSTSAFYRRRRHDAAFAQDWRMALLAGYDRIEAALIRKALGCADHAPVVDSAATGVGPADGEVDVNIALVLLSRHRPAADKLTRDAKDSAFRASGETTATALLKKLKAHAKLPEIAAKAAIAKATDA